MIGVGIVIFPDPGFHCIAMESVIRPYRPETGDSDWTFWAINLYVLLWTFHNLLGTGAKVRTHPVNQDC
jgi:hypothetical protein